MEFTDVRLKELGSSKCGVITEGIIHNFYDLRGSPLSKSEKDLAFLLSNIIRNEEPFSKLKAFPKVPSSFASVLREEIIDLVEINTLREHLPSKTLFNTLTESFVKIISDFDFIADKKLFAETVLHNAVGLKQLAFFSLDDELEELMINSLDSIFVFHKKYGMCKVNMVLDEKVLDNLIQRIALSIGKEFNPSIPLLDARLPDGSRVNATKADVSPHGSSLTIRKFSPIPLTILDLIENGTISNELAGFLWTMVDGFGLTPQNILITGGTASGKTSLLNILSNFVRLRERIISIEDTLEISLLGRDNWVAFEAKHFMNNEISMNALLKNALRMRPDRLIVGEVRGDEAITLFTAMNNGHSGVLGTIHSNDSREAVMKLQERPFSVPQSMLALMDLIVVMQRNYSRQEGMKRKVTQIAEVTRMDNKILLANIYDTDEATGEVRRTETPSHIIEVVAKKNMISKNDLKKEIDTRRVILEWMMAKGIRKPLDVLEFIQTYYYQPEKVLSMIVSQQRGAQE